MSLFSREDGPPSILGMGVVAATIVVQFLSTLIHRKIHYVVLEAHTEVPVLFLLLLFSFMEVCIAMTVIQINHDSSTTLELAMVAITAQMGGNLLWNYLIWGHNSSAAACGRVYEPLLCVILLFVVVHIRIERTRLGAVVLISMGAAFLSTKVHLLPDTISFLYLMSSLSFLVRNVIVKHLCDCSFIFSIRRPRAFFMVIGSAFSVFVVLTFFLSPDMILVSILVLIECGLFVALLFFCLTMLSLFDVLTVSVFMTWVKILENLILDTKESTTGLMSIMSGSAMFVIGHYLYFKDGLNDTTVHLNIKQG